MVVAAGFATASLRLKGDFVELVHRDLASPMVEDLGSYQMHAAAASVGTQPTLAVHRKRYQQSAAV